MPKKRHPLLGDKKWLVEQFKIGKSYADIAAVCGVTGGLVTHYIRLHGLPVDTDRSRRTAKGLRAKYPNGRRGASAGNWRGGRMSTTGSKPGGYIRIYKPEHPAATKAGYVYEHRLVMESKIGRLLVAGEVVDHIDRNRSNNAPENLALHASRSAHVKDHFSARDQLVIALRRIGELEEKVAALEAEFGPMGWKRHE